MPMLESFVLPAVNHVLRGNRWALARLTPLAGRVVRFEAAPFILRLAIRDDGVLEAAASDAVPDATIRVTPGVAARLLARDKSAWSEVDVSGDTELAATVNQVWRNVRWDFEEDLARLFGDIPAHRMAEAGRRLQRWSEQSADSVARSLAEYWTEEAPLIASRYDIEQFNAEVDGLRDDAARLEKRIERLSTRAGR